MSHLRSVLPDTMSLGSMPRHQAPDAGTPWLWQEALGRWLSRLRERDELCRLSERERRDAGLTAYDVAFECRKPFWRD